MAWKTLDDMDLAGKRVLTRVDINVPVQDGKVTDTTRIDRIVPTVQDILDKGGKPILMAHFGRPKGQVVPEMSLEVTLPALEEALDRKVAFAEGGWDAAVATLSEGQVLLLENMRFFPRRGEERPRVRERACRAGRCLRERCLLRRPPCPRLHRGRCPPAAGVRRP